MAIGDHLRVRFGCYYHHAIDLGDGTVVHFGRGLHDLANAAIERVTMAEFCDGRPVATVVSTCQYSGSEIARRALGRVGETDYRAFGNNCEAFVVWCRSGESHSKQAEAVKSAVRHATAVAVKPALARRLAGAVVATGPIPEVVQFSVETWCARRSMPQHHGKQAGVVAGAATAFAVGLIKGGPVSGVISTSVWAGGQIAGERMADRVAGWFDGICRRLQRAESR